MKTEHVELLRRLEQFQIDSPGAAFPFSERLARENNWTAAFTQRVIDEYKRFAFLAVAAGHPVSPSEEVDQAWHLHLTYSENYWKIFCPQVLQKPLHHQPTQGGVSERDKFEDWYQRTVESYRTFFGAPPADIWPDPLTHRHEQHRYVRVDRSRNWVIPKPRLRLGFNPRIASGIGLAGMALLCTGAMAGAGVNLFDLRGPEFLMFYAVLFGFVFGLALCVRRSLRGPSPVEAAGLQELDGYAAAFLNGGKILTVNTAIANLVRQNAMRIDSKDKRLISLVPQPTFAHSLERTVYGAADVGDGNSIANVRSSAKPVVAQIAEKLERHGLVISESAARRATAIPLLLTLAVIVLGVIKIVIGLGRGKPVGFLVVFCLISLVASLLAFARRPVRSRHGDRVFRALKEEYMGPRRWGRGTAASPMEFAMILGLFGMTALAGTELDDVRKSLQPPVQASGCGSSCGGGCGSGCGGGCGGCGGG